MSSTVADALTYFNDEETTETRLFIRLFDEFFDCLNVTNKLEGKLKRKDARLAYYKAEDKRFKVVVACMCVCVCNITVPIIPTTVAEGHFSEVLG